MNDAEFVRMMASIILASSPLIIAVCGETITERSGVVNLSLDGTMLMAAMTGFVVGLKTENVWLGFLAGAIVGAIFGAIVAYGSISLGKSQVAVGFVLTLLGDDLSAFLGQNFTRIPGEVVRRFGIPILKDIPVIGPIFFNQDIMVYFSYLLIILTWWFIARTQPGLHLRSSGERPDAAFARGVNVRRVRYLYALLGGALVGIAGAAYSLDVKIGWSEGATRGLGWIALAIVIFGGWSPVRGALGAILFGATKAMATILQRTFPEISVVAFNSIPWVLMLAVLFVVGSDVTERLIEYMPRRLQPPLRRMLRITAPLALGSSIAEK
jgi:simple sugar transport system permease protein